MGFPASGPGNTVAATNETASGIAGPARPGRGDVVDPPVAAPTMKKEPGRPGATRRDGGKGTEGGGPDAAEGGAGAQKGAPRERPGGGTTAPGPGGGRGSDPHVFSPGGGGGPARPRDPLKGPSLPPPRQLARR